MEGEEIAWFWVLISLLLLSFCVCAVSTIYSCCCPCPRGSRGDRRSCVCCSCLGKDPASSSYLYSENLANTESNSSSQSSSQSLKTSAFSATEKARVKAMMPHCRLAKYRVKKLSLLLGVSPKCNNDVCPVCLESFLEGNDIVIAPCKHGYHLNCIEGWLKEKGICPLCRRPIQNEYNETSPLLHFFV